MAKNETLFCIFCRRYMQVWCQVNTWEVGCLRWFSSLSGWVKTPVLVNMTEYYKNYKLTWDYSKYYTPMLIVFQNNLVRLSINHFCLSSPLGAFWHIRSHTCSVSVTWGTQLLYITPPKLQSGIEWNFNITLVTCPHCDLLF